MRKSGEAQSAAVTATTAAAEAAEAAKAALAEKDATDKRIPVVDPTIPEIERETAAGLTAEKAAAAAALTQANAERAKAEAAKAAASSAQLAAQARWQRIQKSLKILKPDIAITTPDLPATTALSTSTLAATESLTTQADAAAAAAFDAGRVAAPQILPLPQIATLLQQDPEQTYPIKDSILSFPLHADYPTLNGLINGIIKLAQKDSKSDVKIEGELVVSGDKDGNLTIVVPLSVKKGITFHPKITWKGKIKKGTTPSAAEVEEYKRKEDLEGMSVLFPVSLPPSSLVQLETVSLSTGYGALDKLTSLFRGFINNKINWALQTFVTPTLIRSLLRKIPYPYQIPGQNVWLQLDPLSITLYLPIVTEKNFSLRADVKARVKTTLSTKPPVSETRIALATTTIEQINPLPAPQKFEIDMPLDVAYSDINLRLTSYFSKNPIFKIGAKSITVKNTAVYGNTTGALIIELEVIGDFKGKAIVSAKPVYANQKLSFENVKTESQGELASLAQTVQTALGLEINLSDTIASIPEKLTTFLDSPLFKSLMIEKLGVAPTFLVQLDKTDGVVISNPTVGLNGVYLGAHVKGFVSVDLFSTLGED